MNISQFRLNEWQVYRERICAELDRAPMNTSTPGPRRLRLADREITCWELMRDIEDRAAALIAATREMKNVPGELKYHIDRLAAATDRSEDIITRITPKQSAPSA